MKKTQLTETLEKCSSFFRWTGKVFAILMIVICGYGQALGQGAVCGNGIVEAPEGCDDGNLVSGDGCNSVCQITLPILTSISPTNGPIGATVTITGVNFSATPSQNIVMFNGTAATVSASTTTSITTTVPVGATTGVISVSFSGQTTSRNSFVVGANYGPQFPPPLNYIHNTSVSLGQAQPRAIGSTNGLNHYFSSISLSDQTSVYWGAVNGEIKLSMDGPTYTGSEIFVFSPSLSNLPGGILVWTGPTAGWYNRSGIFISFPTLFTMKFTNTSGGTAVPLISPSSLNLPAGIGGVVKFADHNAAITVNIKFTATNGTGILDLYDNNNSGPSVVYTSFDGGFYWANVPPKLTTNAGLTVNEAASATITPAMLLATDVEEDAAPAHPENIIFGFDYNTQTQNDPAVYHGTLTKNGVPLTRSGTFTRKDIVDNKIVYTHDGSENSLTDNILLTIKDSKGAYAIDNGFSVYNFVVTITPVNDPPVTNDLNFLSSFAQTLNGQLTAADPDSPNLTYEVVSPPSRGNLTVTAATGAFSYIPSGGAGPVSFTYKAHDGNSYGNTATVSVDLINSPPSAPPQNENTTEGVALDGTLQATDPENGSLSFSIVADPTHGTLDLVGNTFHYQPNANYFGTDEFTYSATDTNNGTVNGAITIKVRPSLDGGDLLISDKTRIVLVDPTHQMDGILFSGNNLQNAQHVFHKKGGQVYVIDNTSGLLKIDPSNGSQSVLIPRSSFNSNPGPLGLIENEVGDLIVTDGPNGIRKINSTTGAISTLFSGGNLIMPAAIAELSDGSYLVSDAGLFAGQTSKIIKIESDGTQTIISQAGSLKIPIDFTLIDATTILVSDGGSLAGGADAIIKVDLTNGQQTVLSTGGQLAFPSGAAFNIATSKFYVINKGNKKLLNIDSGNGQQTQLTLQTSLSDPFGLSIIGRQSQTISFDPISAKNYGDVTFDLSASSSSGLDVSYSSSNTNVATISANHVTIVGAGSTTITATQEGNSNYNAALLIEQTFTVGQATLTAKGDDMNKVYGQTNPTFTSSYTGFVNGDVAAAIDTPPTASSLATALSDVGQYDIDVTGGTDNNYLIVVDVNKGKLTVNKANLTAKANDASKQYGESNPVFSLSYTGFANGDGASSIDTAPVASSSASASSDVGQYDIDVTGGTDNNYLLVADATTGKLTITTATLLAKGDDKSRMYGEVNPALTVSYSGFVNGDDAGDVDTPPTATTLAASSSDAGQYDIDVTGGADNNYTVIADASKGKLTVDKATLTVKAVDVSKTYGVSNPTFTIGYTGLVNGDLASSIDTSPTASSTATSASSVGEYDIDVTGGSDNNYVFLADPTKGKLTIQKALISAKANDKSKAYGASNPIFTIVYTGLLNGDLASAIDTAPVASCLATESSNVGEYDISITGGSDNNYNIVVDATKGKLSINKATLTAKADDKAKIYGEANPTLTISYVGFVNGEGLSVIDTSPTASSLATASSNAGEYDVDVTGGADNNYSIVASTLRGKLTINKATQSVTFTALQNKSLGDPDFTLTATASSGLVVSYSSSNISVATIATDVVHLVGSGATTITAGQAGNQNYLPATSVEQTLTVVANKQSQTITFAPIPDKKQGGPPVHLSATATSKLTVVFSTTSDKVTIAGNQATLVKPGKVTIKADQPGNEFYLAAPTVERTFCISPETPTISINNSSIASPILTSSANAGNQWYLNGTAITGATAKTHTVSSKGRYQVSVTVDDCVSELSTPIIYLITGDEPQNGVAAPRAKIYPNPVEHNLIIQLDGFNPEREVNIRLVDGTGRTVNELTGAGEQEVNVQVGHYSAGIYMVQLIQGKETQQIRFVKK